jgi:hypothetical protein
MREGGLAGVVHTNDLIVERADVLQLTFHLWLDYWREGAIPLVSFLSPGLSGFVQP